jgi:hypothetical protein
VGLLLGGALVFFIVAVAAVTGYQARRHPRGAGMVLLVMIAALVAAGVPVAVGAGVILAVSVPAGVGAAARSHPWAAGIGTLVVVTVLVADPVISALLPRQSTATRWDSAVPIAGGRSLLVRYGHGDCDEHAANRVMESPTDVTVIVFVRPNRNWMRLTPIPQGCSAALRLDSTVIVLPDDLGGRQILDGSKIS